MDLDLYVKLFGTDAVFLSLGDDKGYDFNNFLDESLKFVNEGIDKAKHFQVRFYFSYLCFLFVHIFTHIFCAVKFAYETTDLKI